MSLFKNDDGKVNEFLLWIVVMVALVMFAAGGLGGLGQAVQDGRERGNRWDTSGAARAGETLDQVLPLDFLGGDDGEAG